MVVEAAVRLASGTLLRAAGHCARLAVDGYVPGTRGGVVATAANTPGGSWPNAFVLHVGSPGSRDRCAACPSARLAFWPAGTRAPHSIAAWVLGAVG